jgi:hypothetical protein
VGYRVCVLASILFLIPTLGISQEEGASPSEEVVREQTRDAILHLERAERLLKLGELDKALVEYEYIVRFCPHSIYAQEAKRMLEEIGERMGAAKRPKAVERAREEILEPTRLAFAPTSETLRQGVVNVGAGTATFGEIKVGIYDWLEIGLNTALVDLKAQILKDSGSIPSFALGVSALPWDLEHGKIYGVLGKRIRDGRLRGYAGYSFISGYGSAFGGIRLFISPRASIMIEYNQPVWLDDVEGSSKYLEFYNNFNTFSATLRYVFPLQIGVEGGIGIYTDREWYEEGGHGNYREIQKLFMRFQLFWSTRI